MITRRPPAPAAACALSLVTAFLALGAPAHASPPCGVRGSMARPPGVADALFVLRAAVGAPGLCGPCTCNVDRSGSISAVDAAVVLRAAVGLGGPLQCPVCSCRAAPRIAMGASPRSVSVADVDDDGRADLITANTESDEIVVRYGSSRGRFDGYAQFWVDETPLSATVVDLDADGIEDVVTTNALPGNLSILKGNAGGTFGSFGGELSVEAGLAPIHAAATDVDGDRVLDLVVANSLSHDVSVLLGNGDATFRTYARIAVGRGPRWVSVADLDGDSIADAVTANRDDDDLSVLKGAGDGGFAETERIAVAAGPYHVVTDDMNGDAVTDLVVASYYGEGVSVLLGIGDGRFIAPAFVATHASAIALTTGDLDQDGLPDVAVANLPRSVTVLLGTGGGNLGPPVTYAAQGGPRAIAIHDADDDGNPDLLVASSHSDDVNILHGAGDGTFSSEHVSPAARFGIAMATADLNADGQLDIALAGQHYWISTHLGDGAGSFVQAVRVPTRNSPQQVFAVQVDGNSATDLLLVSVPYCWDECYDVEPYRPYVSFFLGNGDGSLSEEHVVPDLVASILTVADLDGDGLSDIVAEDIDLPGLAVLRGVGAAGFELAGRVDVAEAAAIELGDLSGDEIVDLLYVESASDRVGVAIGDGAEGFDPSTFYATGTDPSAVLAGDVDSDGRADVLVTNAGSNDVSVLLALPAGGFAPEIRSPGGGALRSARLVDLDADHALDLIGMQAGVAYAMRGDARGKFAAPTPIVGNVPGATFVHAPVSAVAVARFDADALPDAVGVNSTARDPTFVTVARAGSCLLP